MEFRLIRLAAEGQIVIDDDQKDEILSVLPVGFGPHDIANQSQMFGEHFLMRNEVTLDFDQPVGSGSAARDLRDGAR